MTADEIRAMDTLTQSDYLREIAAQLAELNAILRAGVKIDLEGNAIKVHSTD